MSRPHLIGNRLEKNRDSSGYKSSGEKGVIDSHIKICNLLKKDELIAEKKTSKISSSAFRSMKNGTHSHTEVNLKFINPFINKKSMATAGCSTLTTFSVYADFEF